MGTELSGGRVLVVDDDRVNRMLLTRSLEREGTMAALSLPSRLRTTAERRPVCGDDRRAPLCRRARVQCHVVPAAYGGGSPADATRELDALIEPTVRARSASRLSSGRMPLWGELSLRLEVPTAGPLAERPALGKRRTSY
jgi:hypothetical protein